MSKNLFDLTDKVIIVTGGAGLLGEKFCESLIDYGAKVVIADINYTKAKKVEKKLGKNSFAIKTDITSEKSIRNMKNKVLDNYQNIDVLINNAYPRNENYGVKFENIEIGDWRENIDLHLNGYFAISKII